MPAIILVMDAAWLPPLAVLIATNSAPVVAAWLWRGRPARPIDGGRTWRDGRPLLGSHKTWRGLAAAVLAGAAMAPWLGLAVWRGALAGLLAIAGDAASSFVKRRLGRPSGASVHGLDQLPEALLPLLVLWRPLGLDVATAVVAVVAFAVLDALTVRGLTALRHRRPPSPDAGRRS